MIHQQHKNALKPAALPFAVAAALVPTAMMPSLASAQDSESQDELDTVVVTGSRIPRSSEVEGTSPVLTIDRAAIEATGLTSVGDVLFNIASSDGGALRNVTTGTNGSDGTQNISLRGLGANRTLVLVNGRRWVTAGITNAAVVDLNTIPVSVVERIEVLKDGASAIYGSDAIAGVINVITRKNFDGAEANVYLGGYSKGDGFQQSYDFTVGANNDRWNAVFNIAYQDQEPVYAGDREISSVPVYGGGDLASGGAFGSGSSLRGNFVRCGTALTPTPAGFQTCTPVAGGPYTLIPGEDGRQPTDFRTFIGYTVDGSGSSDRYNFAPVNYLLQPIERFNVYGQASLRLTDRINFNAMATYVKRESDQQLAEVPLTMDTRGLSGPQWAFAPTAGNVFNPFGQDLRQANFRALAVGPRKPYFNNDNLAVTLSFDGSFDLAGRDMYWDAGYSYLDSRISQRGENFINLFNLRNAVGDSRRNPVTGALECLDGAGAVIAGCVPFNVFGGPDLGLAAGVITQAEYDAMIRYISYTQSALQRMTTKDYFANLSGSIVDLPAGPLGFAVGLEHRRTAYINQPDALVAGGGSSANFTEPTKGNVNVDEIYAELNIPILADLPIAKLLEVNLAARKSDYDSNGFFGGTTVNPDIGGDTSKKIGIKWQVFDDLMFRGTYSESFRAPDVLDLYAGGAESFPAAIDPCNPANIGLATTDAARCIADGAPVGGVPQPNGQIRSLNGGNPDLQPEFGETKSFGVVYSPSWAPGLNFTLDWYNISLEDVISFRGTQAILTACYGAPGSPGAAANPAQRALFCSFVTRDNVGNIIDVRQSQFNLAQGEVEGYDFQVTYAMPETAWGKFTFQWDNTYSTKNTLFGTVGQYNGAPAWRLRSNLTTSWRKGDWDATWAVRYYSGMDELCPFGPNYFEYGITPTELCDQDVNDANGNPLRFENRIGSRFYHDVQIGWKTPWNGKISVGARNLFGKEPPITRNSFAHSFDGAYDLPGGGFFYLQYNQKF
ncbi:MAG: TonB-dependent receptor domain-containing protein [Pseudomonadota bacterium]